MMITPLTSILLITLTIFLLFTPTNTEKLTPVPISDSMLREQSPRSLAIIISNSQPQLLRKVVLHYLLEQIERMQQSQDQMTIKNFLNSWFQQNNVKNVYELIEKHMRKRLSEKLEMDKLTDSFRKEIQENPEEYFLTFDMYDLLIDE